MNDKRPTVFDACTCTGGFSLAFEREGFKTIGFAEIHPAHSYHLAQKWPHVKNFGDIRNIPAGIKATVLTCGDPCQPFSTPGKRQGEKDHRYLWTAVLELLDRGRFDFFLGENVIGIANLLLSKRLDDLEKRGYQSVAFDLPSCAIGLPSVERHIWTIAARKSRFLQGLAKKSHANKYALLQFRECDQRKFDRWNSPESRTLRSSKGVSHRIYSIGESAPPPIAQIFARTIKAALTSAD